jgi:hypothetical protein
MARVLAEGLRVLTVVNPQVSRDLPASRPTGRVGNHRHERHGEVVSHARDYAQLGAGNTGADISRCLDRHERIIGALKNDRGNVDRSQRHSSVAGCQDCCTLPLDTGRIVGACH